MERTGTYEYGLDLLGFNGGLAWNVQERIKILLILMKT